LYRNCCNESKSRHLNNGYLFNLPGGIDKVVVSNSPTLQFGPVWQTIVWSFCFSWRDMKAIYLVQISSPKAVHLPSAPSISQSALNSRSLTLVIVSLILVSPDLSLKMPCKIILSASQPELSILTKSAVSGKGKPFDLFITEPPKIGRDFF
jgi:hypothetical protein